MSEEWGMGMNGDQLLPIYVTMVPLRPPYQIPYHLLVTPYGDN